MNKILLASINCLCEIFKRFEWGPGIKMASMWFANLIFMHAYKCWKLLGEDNEFFLAVALEKSRDLNLKSLLESSLLI